MSLPHFETIERSNRPLVVHQHGNTPGDALIVFIHGLGGDRYRTWTARGNNPAEASLPKFLYNDTDLLTLDIGLYAYQTLFQRLFRRTPDLEKEAALLADHLRDEERNYRTIVLAGHSMGGILARAVVAELIKRNDTETLARIKALFLLATPRPARFVCHLFSAR